MGEGGPSFRTPRARERFALRTVTLAAGDARPYEAAEWKGALVVVERGDVELETSTGARWRFREGEILSLEDLPLKALWAPGPAATLLLAVSRRRR